MLESTDQAGFEPGSLPSGAAQTGPALVIASQVPKALIKAFSVGHTLYPTTLNLVTILRRDKKIKLKLLPFSAVKSFNYILFVAEEHLLKQKNDIFCLLHCKFL